MANDPKKTNEQTDKNSAAYDRGRLDGSTGVRTSKYQRDLIEEVLGPSEEKRYYEKGVRDSKNSSK